ncbi:hypothetical protein NSA56_01520 [Oceanobacillus caeni]|uniref:hypothetical protein n=1 Tax=Oceanobacillus caeni TaxID=405946 RepID=UPI002149BB94|nr:hypothetical protein [Oceanobacillus caeni]MCR1833074.1 hypothetical protein [Oceanobacillus caeni]
MIEELKRGRKLLNGVYAMDDLDKRALEDSKVIMAKASSEILRLQEDNEKLREFISENIS